jgi:glucose/arabinose dehydrogenase
MAMQGLRRTLLSLVVALAMAGSLPAPVLAQDRLEPALGDQLRSERLLSGLQYPSSAAFLPDGRLVILQLGGDVLLWDGTNPPKLAGQVGVEMDGERGLLGLAVDPQFGESGRLYLYYSVAGKQRVGYAVLDAKSGQLGAVVDLVTDLAADRDHNGGGIAFGPDGLLYFGTGDSGCSRSRPPGDGENYLATCLTRLEGKINRIDRDGGIPASNPLVGAEAVTACPVGSTCEAVRTVPDKATKAAPRGEIYNWGLRNPWRFTFDSQTGYLWIGDVGEVTWEEITVSTGPAQHHGWPWREGVRGGSNYSCGEWTPASGECVEPAFAYSHFEEPADGQGAVVGGVFTQHCSWPTAFRGNYWFGDFTKNRIWMLSVNSDRTGVVGERTLIVDGAGGPVHFVTAPGGALYYLSHLDGELWAVRPARPADCDGQSAASPAAEAASATGTAAATGAAGAAEAPTGGCGCSAVPPAGRGAGLLALGLTLLLCVLRRQGGDV